MFFRSAFEGESTKTEMVACAHCSEIGIVRLNPKNMDGKETKLQDSDFVADIEVVRWGSRVIPLFTTTNLIPALKRGRRTLQVHLTTKKQV